MVSDHYHSRPLSPKIDDMCNAKPVNKTSLLIGEMTEPQSQAEEYITIEQLIWSNYSDYTSLLLSTTTLLNNDMCITDHEPVEETAFPINEMIVAPSGYKFTSEFKSAPAANLDLDQEHKDPVTHSHCPKDSHHYSPVIHPSSVVTQQLLVIGLNFEHLKEQLTDKVDSHPINNISSTNKGRFISHNNTSSFMLTNASKNTHCYSQLLIKEHLYPITTSVLNESPPRSVEALSFSSSSAVSLESFRLFCPLYNSDITSSSCNHNRGILTSKDGIKITIPKGAYRPGVIVNFYIAVGLYGHFVLPSNCQINLASPYYWVKVSESYDFQKPIQVKFEHFGACDPSHYQLLCCEDDDESYTMRPVDCSINFEVQDNMCTFETQHFCSYCLCHNCNDPDDPITNRIHALYLKPVNFQCLNHFKVEIWFSFPISYCLERNKKLYTKKNMILDEECSFEASTYINSTSCFNLSHVSKKDSWSLEHFPFSEIQTHQWRRKQKKVGGAQV